MFAEWNQVVAKLSVKDYLEQTREYLKMEYPAIRSACFIRSARIVRCNAFIYQLKLAFEQLQHCYHKLFNQHGQIITSISDSLNSKQKLT